MMRAAHRGSLVLIVLIVLAALAACRGASPSDAPDAGGVGSRTSSQPTSATEPPTPDPGIAAWIEVAETYAQTACACANASCAEDAATRAAMAYRDLRLRGIEPPGSPSDVQRMGGATRRAAECAGRLDRQEGTPLADGGKGAP